MNSLFRYVAWDVAGALVLYRIDANVSFGEVEHRRLSGMRATLSALIAAGARVSILAHRGRPTGFDSKLTLQPLKEYCARYGFLPPSVTILENVRFDSREYSNDPTYGAELARGYDYYVTDAWASLHNNQASLVAAALQFPLERRSIGNLVAHEIAMLKPLRDGLYNRWSILLGGGKVSEKIQSIVRAYQRGATPSIYLGPGGTRADADALRHAAPSREIIFFEGNLTEPELVRGISCRTAEMIFQQVMTNDALFITGPMGVASNGHHYEQLLRRIENGYNGDLFVGGGGTSELYDNLFPYGRAFVSSGGGATLAYICGDALPGLAVIAGTSVCL